MKGPVVAAAVFVQSESFVSGKLQFAFKRHHEILAILAGLAEQTVRQIHADHWVFNGNLNGTRVPASFIVHLPYRIYRTPLSKVPVLRLELELPNNARMLYYFY